MGCSSSQAAPACNPSTGCSPTGTDRSSNQSHKSCQQFSFSVGSLQGHSILQASACSGMVSLPWEMVLHELLNESHKTCQQTCSSMGSCLHRAKGPGRTPLQSRLSMGSQSPSGICLLQHGPPWAAGGYLLHCCCINLAENKPPCILTLFTGVGG